MKDYRPIACCNMIYKISSKVLPDHLKRVLPSLIGQNQNVFLRGHLISKNIMLMQKLVYNYRRDGGKPKYAIKIQLMKAYKTVDWKFLFTIMRLMNFFGMIY